MRNRFAAHTPSRVVAHFLSSKGWTEENGTYSHPDFGSLSNIIYAVLGKHIAKSEDPAKEAEDFAAFWRENY